MNKQTMQHRRNVLKGMTLGSMLGLVSGSMLGLVSMPGFAQGALHSTPVTDSITLISGAGANVVVAVGASGVVVVDGGSESSAPALLAEINRLSGNKPIVALFNTNWRPDKSGLNHLLGPAGTPIIAHENTRLWQTADLYVDWENTTYTPMEAAAQANQTFYKTGSLDFEGEVIEYGRIKEANTDGDIYVHFTGADVLVVGDMLGVDHYLMLDYVTGGWITGAQRTTEQLLERAGANTRIIAAHGGVVGKAALQAQADMLSHAYDQVALAFQNGRSLEEFLALDPMAPYRAQWGDPTLFVTLLYRGTWYHVPGRAVRNII